MYIYIVVYIVYMYINNYIYFSPIPNCDSSQSAASGFVFQIFSEVELSGISFVVVVVGCRLFVVVVVVHCDCC